MDVEFRFRKFQITDLNKDPSEPTIYPPGSISGSLILSPFFGQIVGSFLFDRWQQINLAWPTPQLSLTPPPFQKSGPIAEEIRSLVGRMMAKNVRCLGTRSRNPGHQKKSGFWRVCRKYLEQRAKTGRAFIFGDIEHYQVMVLSSQRKGKRGREKCENERPTACTEAHVE